MAFVSVPKDLTKVKNKIIFNLTKRQLICFGIAAAVGVPFYFLTRGIIGSSNAATGMCLLMLPAFLFAMYEKDGLPLEKVLKNMITVKFITKRQLICFGIAAAVGVPFYFLTRGIIGSSNAATGMCLLMLPAFLFAMYEKDGLPLEKVLKNMITVKFIRPPVRKYQMENLYEKKFIMVRKKKGGQKSVKKKKR